MERSGRNPILGPASVAPTRAGLEVVGVFNPGATEVDGETVLLLRVAEAPVGVEEGSVAAPVYDAGRGEIVVHTFRRDDPSVDASDPRELRVAGRTLLTSISHLRVARSRDGERFEGGRRADLEPSSKLEAYGVEDPRITRIDDRWWVTYTAVSSHGIATALASTTDFRSFERHGILFPPNDRNVTIFPERIGGDYVALHRPMPHGLGRPAIWIARSPDLRAWGEHHPLTKPRAGAWDEDKVGGGAVPFRVHDGELRGWLAIYHGVRSHPTTYSLGVLLLDEGDPSRVIGRSLRPVLAPEAAYERSGFFDHVVFTCGAVVEREPADRATAVRIYYGAADGVTAMARTTVFELLASLRP